MKNQNNPLLVVSDHPEITMGKINQKDDFFAAYGELSFCRITLMNDRHDSFSKALYPFFKAHADKNVLHILLVEDENLNNAHETPLIYQLSHLCKNHTYGIIAVRNERGFRTGKGIVRRRGDDYVLSLITITRTERS